MQTNLKTTPKDFFLWVGAIVSLYWSITSFIQLVFNEISYTFPTLLSQVRDPYQSGMSYEMASLIILFPLLLLIMNVIRHDLAKDPSRSEIWVRRWALYLTLFLAGATMVGDLIILLNSFLSGQTILLPFLLEVAIVFLVSVALFLHFIADLRGYWSEFPKRLHRISWVIGVLIALTILAGFLIVGTPAHARLVLLDQGKVQDLQTINEEIISYWQGNQKLPVSLATLSFDGISLPIDPQSGDSYSYQVTGKLTYNLCAIFNGQSTTETIGSVSMPMIPAGSGVGESWGHTAGYNCFHLSIRNFIPAPIVQ